MNKYFLMKAILILIIISVTYYKRKEAADMEVSLREEARAKGYYYYLY
jgi:hypothetical protein